MNTYIYCITNKINGKQYVGKTCDTIEQRFKEHISSINTQRDKKRPLYSAMRKYGVDNFVISLLEECPEKEADERECFWINKLNTYNNGYNATMGGDGNLKYNHDKIWEKYQELGKISETAHYFGCDRRVVKSIINKHGIYNEANPSNLPVYQLDKNTLEIVANYPSIAAACRAINGTPPSIKSATTNINNTAYGFRWCLQNEYQNLEKPSKRIIEQIDKNTNKVINKYNTYTEAAKAIGSPEGFTNIRKVCIGQRKTAYGYK